MGYGTFLTASIRKHQQHQSWGHRVYFFSQMYYKDISYIHHYATTYYNTYYPIHVYLNMMLGYILLIKSRVNDTSYHTKPVQNSLLSCGTRHAPPCLLIDVVPVALTEQHPWGVVKVHSIIRLVNNVWQSPVQYIFLYATGGKFFLVPWFTAGYLFPCSITACVMAQINCVWHKTVFRS